MKTNLTCESIWIFLEKKSSSSNNFILWQPWQHTRRGFHKIDQTFIYIQKIFFIRKQIKYHNLYGRTTEITRTRLRSAPATKTSRFALFRLYQWLPNSSRSAQWHWRRRTQRELNRFRSPWRRRFVRYMKAFFEEFTKYLRYLLFLDTIRCWRTVEWSNRPLHHFVRTTLCTIRWCCRSRHFLNNPSQSHRSNIIVFVMWTLCILWRTTHWPSWNHPYWYDWVR